MEKLVITPDAYAPLFEASGALELCDPAGHTVGYFYRTDAQIIDDPAIYEWVKAQISDEELERRCREPGTLRTTAEVLERLERL